MERKSYITAVDLGSSNVIVAVAAMEEAGLELKALVSKPVQGVRAGQIDNIEQVSQAVVAAIAEAGAEAGIRITEAYAGVSGEFVRCARHTDYVFVGNPQNGVSEQDVKSLFDRMRNLQAPEKEVIMEHIPQNYLVDDEQEVLNPIGSFGRKLSSTFNFVLCATTPMERIEMALKRAGVLLAGVLPNSLAVPEAVLTPDEKEEGVAVVDIGGGVTDVTVYYRNVVRYIASIPIGASAINQDIRTMGVPERYVENLKKQYGSAVAEGVSEDIMVSIHGRTARESRDILLRNLATVIESRAMDIAEFVKEELKISGYDTRLAYGIVLTGGSANLRDFDQLFHKVTEREVRVALPENGFTPESQACLANPMYATVAGLLLKSAERSARGTAYIPDPNAAQRVVKPAPAMPNMTMSTPQPVQPAQPQQPAQPVQPKQPIASVQPKQPVQPQMPAATPALKPVVTPMQTQAPIQTPVQTPVQTPTQPPVQTPTAQPQPTQAPVATPTTTPTEKPYVPADEPANVEQTAPQVTDSEEAEVAKPKRGFLAKVGDWAKKVTEVFESTSDEEI